VAPRTPGVAARPIPCAAGPVAEGVPMKPGPERAVAVGEWEVAVAVMLAVPPEVTLAEPSTAAARGTGAELGMAVETGTGTGAARAVSSPAILQRAAARGAGRAAAAGARGVTAHSGPRAGRAGRSPVRPSIRAPVAMDRPGARPPAPRVHPGFRHRGRFSSYRVRTGHRVLQRVAALGDDAATTRTVVGHERAVAVTRPGPRPRLTVATRAAARARTSWRTGYPK
jgi:hypothetical protein